MYKYLLPLFLCAFLSAENFIPADDPLPGKWFLDSIKFTRPLVEKKYREKLDKLGPPQERARGAEMHNQLMDLLLIGWW